MQLPKDLVAASAVPLVLSILERGDSYGYEILRQVREVSEGSLEWTEGMLYPVLHRLEAQGWVEAFWGESEVGRKRKYYRIRDEGRRELAAQKDRWNRGHQILGRSWGRDKEV